jgi:hypothetical protein
MKADKKQYRAYLLRCWREGVNDTINPPEWRLSIETSDGRNIRRGFTRLSDLLLFLRDDLQLADEDGLSK